ncbi:signal peptidase II [Fervidibacillus halotolerans]|uniref:Lipoprotein signal peptidase n=1 Tax=Fervidibacillus halotolerans TaxID=2980027 RepID=A0A9E8RZZ1_9BACI|nr:signal peptidase II [Fervidibacillus halotolerans]WAA13664.1 signal peptidase II [Fervidibacillus halotolerans]
MFIYYVVSLIVILLDQFTKWLIVSKLELYESFSVIDGFLYITSHRNKGAAWGILEGQMWFFYLITVFVIVFLVYYIQKHGKEKRFFSFSLALILGGAIGNFIDRIFRKEVVDFIDVYIFSYDYPIFNVADSALVIGVGLLIIQMIMEEKQRKR